MNRVVISLALLLFAGTSSVCIAKKKGKNEINPESVYPPMFVNQSNEEAVNRLMEVATRLAGNNPARNVELTRIYYLGGQPELGQQLLDSLLVDTADAKTWLSAGKLFYYNGETERALAALDQAATRLLEIGVATPAMWPEPALNADSLERFRQMHP